MNQYEQAIARILKAQESIIGPLAFEQAKSVTNLKIDSEGSVIIVGDGRSALQSVVDKFSEFFGQASVEVCREAIQNVKEPLSSDQLPDILK